MHSVPFRCNLAETTGPLPHFWEHTVGSCHAAMALRADWQAQLRRCHAELGFRHVRFHAVLSDDMGTLMDERNRLLYSFFNADQIWDYLLSIGMKPFVELSFMPTALASGDTTVFHYRSNVTPPKDFKQWAKLIHKLVAHWVERYGVEEVRTWFFEVWNEPNLKAFWPSTQANYFKLYRYTVQAIKEIDDRLQVGGPATAKDEWITEFLDFCEKHHLPADFVSTHHYPTDALGAVGDDTLTQLAHSERGILREWAQKTHCQSRGRPLYYTEWNVSSNPRDPLHDEPYTAAVVVKTMMEANGLVEGYSFWAFSDIFAENYFPSEPFQGGFGLLTLHGVAKPSYRAFELLHHLGAEQCLVDGSHETVDAWVVRRPSGATVLLDNSALPRHPIDTERIHVQLTGAAPPRNVYVERIDEDHANAKRRWLEIGKPEFPTAAEVEQLRAASQMVREQQPWKYEDGAVQLELALPPQAIAAVTLEFAPEPAKKGPR
ncbi:MAG TPA: glycosyl hydrolase [Pirellulales bacterium]|nr:glycosyl hydrolase [Pirellulales bacterium]